MIGWGRCLLVQKMLIMNRRTRVLLVPFVLCAMGAVVLSSAGCRREKEKKLEVTAPSPAEYMKDPVFRRQLEEKRKELQAVVKERAPLVARMEELVKAHNEDLSALQKLPEWGELHKKVTELNAKYEEVRKRQLRIAAERIAPKREISK